MDLNINNRIKCKCKGCTNRYIGCHDNCSDYKSYKREWNTPIFIVFLLIFLFTMLQHYDII